MPSQTGEVSCTHAWPGLPARAAVRRRALAISSELVPLASPASASLVKFGREVKGVDPGNLGTEEFHFVEEALYKVGIM